MGKRNTTNKKTSGSTGENVTQLLVGAGLFIILLFIELVVVSVTTADYDRRNATFLVKDIKDKKEQIAEYRKHIVRAIELNEHHGMARMMYANIFIVDRLYKEALEQIIEAAGLYNIRGVGYRQIGFVYSRLQQPDKAQEYFEKALIIIPEDPITLEYLALLKIKKKNYNEALKYLSVTTKDDMPRPSTYYLLGNISEKRDKNIRRAADYYERAIQAYQASDDEVRKICFFKPDTLSEYIKALKIVLARQQ